MKTDTNVDNEKQLSQKRSIVCGVPQASVLGPLLFLVDVNELPEVCTNYKINVFAYDTTLFGTVEDEGKSMPDELQRISLWMESNKLAVNEGKS